LWLIKWKQKAKIKSAKPRTAAARGALARIKKKNTNLNSYEKDNLHFIIAGTGSCIFPTNLV
jgi:hypothetical protein